MQRIHSLDYLRGLMAMAVMAFHYYKWHTGIWDAQTLLGKLGVYAVSAFFVLSGMTLAHVYQNRLGSTSAELKHYFIQRFIRIFPLLWLVTLITIALNDHTDWMTALLNLTGLFVCFVPIRDIAHGVWSIGNELVYYAIFPIFIYFFRRKQPFWMLVILGASMLLGGMYAFVWLHAEQSFVQQWDVYVQPMNHAFFFFAGAFLTLEWKPRNRQTMLFLAFCFGLLFCFWPIGSDPNELILGWDRVMLSLAVIGLCACIYHLDFVAEQPLHRVLSWLGDISYALYLIHPLAYRLLNFVAAQAQIDAPRLLLVLGICLSFLLAHLTTQFFDRPIRKALQALLSGNRI
jgi:exopolysaccharide production protein ExoZ